MADNDKNTEPSAESVRISPMQRLLDNHFLLLFIGVVVPTVFYLLWGVMELSQIPIAQ
ncbi:MAG: hypothetical protein QM488_13295 [Rhizobiaceae bacterium]